MASQSDIDNPDMDESGCPVLTEAYLKKFLNRNLNLYYGTPEVNDCLYLHRKGFKELKNMHLFPNLKCLYFEANRCNSMNGLETNVHLKSLFF